MIGNPVTDKFFTGLISRLMPSGLLWKIDTREKAIFLTFDDGPIPGLTEEILDILDQFGAKATFFCVGENVRKYPEIFSAVKKRGHAVGNHTQHHMKGVGKGLDEYLEDIRKANIYVDSKLFRPPYGLMTPWQAKALAREYTVVMWTVLTRDFDPSVRPEECLNLALEGVAPGSIIVFHDNIKARRNVLYALPRLLEYARSEGYECRLISDW